MLFYTVEPQEQNDPEPKTSWAELDAKVLDIENVVYSVFVNCPECSVFHNQTSKLCEKFIGKNMLLLVLDSRSDNLYQQV